jgi:rod shape-determining protein MreC
VLLLRFRSDLALVVACLGLYVASAAQVRTERGSALYVAVATLSAPVLGAAGSAGAAWEALLGRRRSLAAALEENAHLRSELEGLKRTNQALAAELVALREGSRLLAAFPSLTDGGVIARVVARDLVGTHTLVLDRGRSHGIRVDGAVLAETGVLGRIDRVADNSARVQLLTHPAAAAAARLEQADQELLLLGGEAPQLTGLPPYTEVAAGQPVLTTGSEGIYPPDLLLGGTTDARLERAFTVVGVRLAARPAHVATVLVLPPLRSAAP